ncbi:MAG: hypothetical protein K0S33_1995 [Bacteroidetes bacterium]|nr:hypothetical protein [Bacteroidota bacterium]
METRITLPGVRPKANTNSLVIITGAVAAAAMTLYFLIMRAIGLHYVIELRYLNILIMFAAVIYTISYHKRIQGRVKYLEGLKIGFLTSIVSSALFSVFLVIYLVNDPPFVHYLTQHALLGDDMGPLAIGGLSFAEGLTSGSIFGFVAMQYFRTRA